MIDIGIKCRHNRYNRYSWNIDIIDIINIGVKYRVNKYRYRYKI